MSSNDDDEFFGDDSFLADFDVDSAVNKLEQQQQQNNNNKRSQYSLSTTSDAPGPDIMATKSHPFKIVSPPTPDPSSSSAAVAAAKRVKMEEESGKSPSQQQSANKNQQQKNEHNSNEHEDDDDHNNNNHVSSLTRTLQDYFGYTQFRPGQISVLEAVLDRQQDVAIFWATGSGKSLCYQIPALHTGKVAIVISPLISLMQDQVHKLNGLGGGSGNSGGFFMSSSSKKKSSLPSSSSQNLLATFLGSAQGDVLQEEAALQGEFALIYLTPEKLLSGNFLDKLARLHTHHRPVVLIAIDESHCVSEWGHDFRPEFRQIGQALRSHTVLSTIPLMALTATAIPRVQKDIIHSLRMRSPTHVVRQTFDRTNLEITVQKKDRTQAMAAALEPLIDELLRKTKNQKSSSSSSSIGISLPSTIIYAPTRDQVETICSFLQQRIAASSSSSSSTDASSSLSSLSSSSRPLVEAYHAGLSSAVRAQVHTNFLTGKTAVIVATLAFGMGIDKPDTRRVIHYGPPKTMEEYYQQIGRAGRDGLKAECIMWVSDADFDKYKSDFYLGRLTGDAKQATLQSMDALRKYALETDTTCRRKTLLSYFEETPSFGERCGTCDACRNIATYGDDVERDLGPAGARVILKAVASLADQGLSVIEKVVSGTVVESYRYRSGHRGESVQKSLEEAKQAMDKKRPLQYYRELVAPLVARGYLRQGTKQTNVGKFTRAWTTYEITSKGQEALRNPSVPILLPVPESVRRIERQEQERRQRMLEQLSEKGVDLSKIPEQEVADGDGEVIRAYSKWSSHIEMLKRSNRHDRAEQLQLLIATLESWRLNVASKYMIAPGTVLSEHVLVSIAYTVATMAPGLKVNGEALIAAGVRTRELDSLVNELGAWVDQVQPASQNDEHTQHGKESDGHMLFPIGKVSPSKKWEYAVYNANKKTGLAYWESSYQRFSKGEPIQAIAMSPANGRQPIQVSTVAGHLLEALQHGKPVDLKKLSEVLPAPTQGEWRQLMEAEITTGMNVCGNPNTSGSCGGKFTKTDLLKPIMGSAILDTPFAERKEEDRRMFGLWCNRLEWYMALKRVGYEPNFSE